MGIEADLRGREGVEKFLQRKREEFDQLPEKEKEEFEKEALENPYLDSGILNIAQEKEVKKVLAGIDIEPAELLIAKKLGVDLVIAHHPLGRGLAHLSEVMDLQCDILSSYGVPIHIAEGLMRERISEVARGVNALNHQRTVDAARVLKINLITLHTPTDNLGASFIKNLVEKENPETVGQLLNLIKEIPEYQKANEIGAGPKLFAGRKENRCGKIAVTEFTGGTEGSPKLYHYLSLAGVGTVLGMHLKEERRKEAEKAHINVLICGHMSSDSLGLNLFLDKLEKEGIEVIPISGLIRVKRNQE